jgi:peptidyl-prolyl cis-trans isomerase B (cyclophilin B)
MYGAPAPAHPRTGSLNALAVASLVCAFVFSPLGIVLGLVARSQIRRTGQRGDGLAVAGIVISIVSLVVGILVLHYDPDAFGGA